MGVNDLAGMADDDRHADMVHEVAREAWHPVSDPPTEEDGKIACYWGERDIEIEWIFDLNWDLFQQEPEEWRGCWWAWPRDVLLMPPEGE